MIEKLIRWMIEKFLKTHHLSHNPTRKTAVVDFPKGIAGEQPRFIPENIDTMQGTNTSGTFKEGVNA